MTMQLRVVLIPAIFEIDDTINVNPAIFWNDDAFKDGIEK
jgi:hypothetical protein